MKRTLVSMVIILSLAAVNAFCMPISHSNSEIERTASDFVSKVVDAYNENNYAKIAAHFNEGMLKDFPQRKFESARKKVFPVTGRIDSIEYLGFRTQSAATLIFYKAQSQTGMIIIKLVLNKDGDSTKIAGLWFE